MSYGAANPLDYLFKLSTQRKIPTPVFSQVIEQGPPHMKTFVWRCTFMNLTAEGQGRSKKEAKTAAARAIKSNLDFSTLPPPPTYQDSLTERKRKKGGNGDGAAPEDGTPRNNKRKKKYDYRRHMMFPPMMMPGGNGNFVDSDGCSDMFMQQMMFNNGGGGGNPMFIPPPMNRMTVDDHYVITKHKAIYPKDTELETILKLVKHAEEALRKASDKLALKNGPAEEDDVKKEEVTEEEKEEKREVMGVARVGELSKGLLLSSDRAVNVVVMCKNKPTFPLLANMVAEMETQLKEVAPDEGYQIHVFNEEGGFCVVSIGEPGDLPYAVNVTLTSTKVRENNEIKEEKADEENKDKNGDDDNNGKTEVEEEAIEPDPEDMLPKKKCLQALAELRRSNWFTTMASPLPSCVECIRIIKEMSNRDPSWNCLSDWAIELLVERALFSAQQPLNPAASLLRVLEVISSGIFLDGGPGLKDPCERESLDACGNLSPQQREDLTHSAQHFIRLITYRKIHKVLGMEKLPPRENKYRNKKKKPKNEAEASADGSAAAAEEGSTAEDIKQETPAS